MQQSGGRRIKRALHIDMTTIRFLDDELRDRLRKVPLLAEFFEQAANDETAQKDAEFGPGRLTNIGVFRAYVTQYLRTHSGIHQDQMTFLVRQLAPTAEGIGIEIYVFSKEQRWVHYEAIQADMVDHLLAVLPEFGLRIFQHPTGYDLARLSAPAA